MTPSPFHMSNIHCFISLLPPSYLTSYLPTPSLMNSVLFFLLLSFLSSSLFVCCRGAGGPIFIASPAGGTSIEDVAEVCMLPPSSTVLFAPLLHDHMSLKLSSSLLSLCLSLSLPTSFRLVLTPLYLSLLLLLYPCRQRYFIPL